MDPIVIDNFLPPKFFLEVKNVITSKAFIWFYKDCITFPGDSSDSLFSYGFEHAVVYEKEIINEELFYHYLREFYIRLLDTTKCRTVTKSRIDMVTYSPSKHQHSVHVDEYFDHIASVFYITDSDAETTIYDQKCFDYDSLKTIDISKMSVLKKVFPKQNRLLIFDGRYLHTGSSPSEYKNRIIINTDLVK
jgi:hypothetical protein